MAFPTGDFGGLGFRGMDQPSDQGGPQPFADGGFRGNAAPPPFTGDWPGANGGVFPGQANGGVFPGMGGPFFSPTQTPTPAPVPIMPAPPAPQWPPVGQGFGGWQGMPQMPQGFPQGFPGQGGPFFSPTMTPTAAPVPINGGQWGAPPPWMNIWGM